MTQRPAPVLASSAANRQFTSACLHLIPIAQKSISRTSQAPASERGASPLVGGSNHAELATKAIPICIVRYCDRGYSVLFFVSRLPFLFSLFLEYIIRFLRLPLFLRAILPAILSLSLFRRILSHPTVKVSKIPSPSLSHLLCGQIRERRRWLGDVVIPTHHWALGSAAPHAHSLVRRRHR